MPNTWTASITLGDPVVSDGLKLQQGVPKRWPESDLTVVPAHKGGSACHHPPPRRERTWDGYWRGSTEKAEGSDGFICLSVESRPAEVLPEAYVSVEFFETELGWLAVQFIREGEDGFVHHVCTPDKTNRWDETWVSTADTNTWQRAVIRLTSPVLKGAGVFNADLKIVASSPLYVRSVTISTERPADFSDHDQLAHARRLEALLRPQYPEANKPVSIGNIGGLFQGEELRHGEATVPWLPVYRAMGITAIQSYVKWSSVESVEGVWDWSLYDWVVERAKRFGLKWVAFIMIGPWYAMPKWWLDTPKNHPNKCLEHDTESWVQSIWSPVMLDYVDRFMKKFAEHYPEELIESIMVGIAGDFGESTTNGVFVGDHYHTHVGYWCGEDVAVEDLRRAMAEKYGSIAGLNEAWGASFAAFDDVKPVQRGDATDRQWLDQTAWYVDRMTWWMQRWGEICREALPHTMLYNAAGGAGDPPRAAHWTDQTRALKHTGMGHRVTNEGADYAFNYAYTAWQGVACRFYGVPFGNEPWGGDMCGAGVLGRIYNAITQHADNYWFYQGHIQHPPGRLAIRRGLPLIAGGYRRLNRVAVFYPWTHFVLVDDYGFSEKGLRDRFWPQVEELRDILDFDYVDDGLIRDGIMENYDFLIVLQGAVYERDELARIAEWVKGGGILITHNIGIPTTVEGDVALGGELLAFGEERTALEKELGAYVARVGKGRTVMFPRCADRKGWRGDDRWKDDHKDHPATHPGFWKMITATLSRASGLGTGCDDYPVVDGERDEVFGAIVERDGERGILYFSQVERDVTKRVVIPDRGVVEATVPAGQILFVPFSKTT